MGFDLPSGTRARLEPAPDDHRGAGRPGAEGTGDVGGTEKEPSEPSRVAGPLLDRAAVERVLARAAALEAEMDAERPVADTGEAGDRISELRLLEIAREVGLSTAGVRQALAEERTRVALDDAGGDPGGWLAHLAGPAVVSAMRVVRPAAPRDTGAQVMAVRPLGPLGNTRPLPLRSGVMQAPLRRGDPDEVIAALDLWMQREECLRVQRHFPDRIVWEPRSDWPGVIRRALRLGGREYHLCRARQVSATVVPADDGTGVVVRLEADVAPRRAARVRLGATAGAAGVGGVAALGALGLVAHAAGVAVAAAAVMPIGAASAAAYAILKGHRHFAARTKLALEQVLDRIAYAYSPL